MMTKLEQKLIELGYKETYYYKDKHKDMYKYSYGNEINFIVYKNRIERSYIASSTFVNQDNINDLQQAFNELQKDLEILKGCEE